MLCPIILTCCDCRPTQHNTTLIQSVTLQHNTTQLDRLVVLRRNDNDNNDNINIQTKDNTTGAVAVAVAMTSNIQHQAFIYFVFDGMQCNAATTYLFSLLLRLAHRSEVEWIRSVVRIELNWIGRREWMHEWMNVLPLFCFVRRRDRRPWMEGCMDAWMAWATVRLPSHSTRNKTTSMWLLLRWESVVLFRNQRINQSEREASKHQTKPMAWHDGRSETYRIESNRNPIPLYYHEEEKCDDTTRRQKMVSRYAIN